MKCLDNKRKTKKKMSNLHWNFKKKMHRNDFAEEKWITIQNQVKQRKWQPTPSIAQNPFSPKWTHCFDLTHVAAQTSLQHHLSDCVLFSSDRLCVPSLSFSWILCDLVKRLSTASKIYVSFVAQIARNDAILRCCSGQKCRHFRYMVSKFFVESARIRCVSCFVECS